MEDYSWPTPKADFFKIGENELNIIIKGNSDLKEEFYSYAIKFKESAGILAEYMLESKEIRTLDTFFFPLAFLYRHSLELILKSIGLKYIQELEDRKSFIKDTRHNLLELINYIEQYIKGSINDDKKAYNWLIKLLEDVNDMDRESDSFRYPFKIIPKIEDGQFPLKVVKQYDVKPIFNKQTHIDLIKFISKMEISFDILKNYYCKSKNINRYYEKFKPIFLEEGGNYYDESVLGYPCIENKFDAYVEAYINSARYIYRCITENKNLTENLFLPMCYLHRNGIELGLKEILFEQSSYDFQQSIKLISKKKHSISGLWNSIKLDVENHANAPKDDNTIYCVERYIKQLHDFDSTSDKFRYPVKKDLDLHFKKRLKLDIGNVSNFFEELESFISGVSSMMSEQNEWKREIEAEYSSYY